MQIEGKVFIVTGGASGLGEGTARMLAAAGGKVVVADLQVERGQTVAQEIGGVFVKCDVSQEADGQAAVVAATAMGKLMGLVNCAGIAPAVKTVGKEGAHPLATFAKTVTVNLIGSFNMIRLAAEAMAKNAPEDTGERGVLISTASVAAYDGQIGQAAYSASKGGVVGMTLPIARDLARNGIRNMTIAPGIFGTPMLFSMPQDVQDAAAELARVLEVMSGAKLEVIAVEAGAWAINPNVHHLNQALVDDAHERGLHVFAWTANEPPLIHNIKQLGVDGIISDFPDRL
jgi:NAD(P)-dependent dehydrogenase (short-subunit alcohol dehydrogenase family)